MGAVYEAEQESPHRTVALKVIRVGYADGQMMRRFENETQALGAALARAKAGTDPELRMLWTEAARNLGKPAPKLQSAKGTAS